MMKVVDQAFMRVSVLNGVFGVLNADMSKSVVEQAFADFDGHLEWICCVKEAP